jgi:hypothetical protein
MVLAVDTSLPTVRPLPALSNRLALSSLSEVSSRSVVSNLTAPSNLIEPNSLPRRSAVVLRINLDIRKLLTCTQTTSGSGMTRAATIPGTISTGLLNMDDFRAASVRVMSSALGEAVPGVLGLADSSSVLPSPTTTSAMIGYGIVIRS